MVTSDRPRKSRRFSARASVSETVGSTRLAAASIAAAGKGVTKAARHHQRQHVLGGLTRPAERAHHLAGEKDGASSRWSQTDPHHIAILRELGGRRLHQSGNGDVVGPHRRLIALEEVGAHQF